MKVKTSKGFTLAELLIVMAIIVVLAAIAIPTFGKQLETARETSDAEAIRALATDAFSAAYTQYITDGSTGTTATTTWKTQIVGPVTMTQKSAGFEYITPTITIGSASKSIASFSAATAGTAISTAPSVYFIFKFEAETGGQGGIKIDGIEYNSTASATNATDATQAYSE